ncbi:MAG: dTMP kinase [Methyloligellaceae bacterium]
MPTGQFITFEGGEGTGKSTQAQHLARRLNKKGIHVMVTREPGGSQRAEQIREVLLNGVDEKLGPLAEALLFSAARDDHMTKIIRPALRAGSWIICDRFTDSTRVYQGVGGGVSEEVLESLEDLVVGNVRPQLTIILDIPAEQGLARAKARRSEGEAADRFEVMDVNFHNTLRSAFLNIADKEPDRCIVVDASGTEAHVADQIWSIVKKKFELNME